MATPDRDASAGRVSPVDDDSSESEHHPRVRRDSEDAGLQAMGKRAFAVRPGLVLGAGDPTDRYSCWAARSAGGGTMLVPDAVENPT